MRGYRWLLLVLSVWFAMWAIINWSLNASMIAGCILIIMMLDIARVRLDKAEKRGRK